MGSRVSRVGERIVRGRRRRREAGGEGAVRRGAVVMIREGFALLVF